jgi:hypothetical protein
MTRSPRARPTFERLLDQSDTTHEEGLLLVGGLGALDLRQTEPRLAQIVMKSEASLAFASADVLYSDASDQQLPGLLERLERGSANRDALLLAISGMLARTSNPDALDQAGRFFLSLYADERDAFLEGFARNPHPHAWQWTLRFMSQANENDLGKIAESIDVSADRSAVLLQLTHHASLHVKLNAVWSLGRVTSDLAESRLIEASSDADPLVRSNAMISLGRIRGARRRTLAPILCPKLRDKEPLIRQAALMGLLASAQRCDDGGERHLLLDDAYERVRRAAALTVTAAQRRFPDGRDAWAMRYCRAFEVNSDIRQHCAFDAAGASSDQLQTTRTFNGALMIASAYGLKSRELTGRVVGLERVDGLVRIAVLDRRGALFEPDIDPSGARFVPARLRH